MTVSLSPEAQARARETLEGFFARMATPTRLEYTVLAGAPNHAGRWPLLLYVCVNQTAPAPEEPLRTVVVLTSRIDGDYFEVADMLGNIPPVGSLPGPLRAKVQACLAAPAPEPSR